MYDAWAWMIDWWDNIVYTSSIIIEIKNNGQSILYVVSAVYVDVLSLNSTW